MRRLPDSTRFYKSLGGARAFRDDLDEILDLLAGAGLKAEIVAGRYVFESLDEVQEYAGARPKTLAIRGYAENRSWHSVEIEFDGGRLTLSGDTTDLGPGGYQLRDHILRLRFTPLYLSFWAWWCVGVAFVVVDLLVPKSTSLWRSALGWTPILCYGIAFATYLVRRQCGGLRLTRRHEGGFFKRNANAIGLLVIGGIVGAVATRILTLVSAR